MKSVLICDDDTEILNVCTLILKKKGYHVVTSDNCENIFELVKKKRPDAILMDLWLPQMGGEAATKKLKANKDTSSIPVILFSAHNDLKHVAKQVAADDYLSKPFGIASLMSMLDKYTSKRIKLAPELSII